MALKLQSYFCESCGGAVSLRAERCPHCGRRFDAVKCPQCSFMGKPDLFVDGCPSCGYLRTGAGIGRSAKGLSKHTGPSDLSTPESASEEPFVGPDPSGGTRGMNIAKSADRKNRHMSRTAFGLLMVGLIGILIVLLILYFRL